MEKIIECKNISKTFKAGFFSSLLKKKKDVKAVDNLSFDVYKGEVYGLLGPNGAGKTTMLRMLATLINQDSGTITIYKNITKKDEIRKRIGFLTNELKLEDCFSADYYFDYFGKLYDMSDEEIKRRKEEVFKILDINSFKDKKYGTLSTGMKQKVSLAVSVMHNPDIVIFDEPTNGLDLVAAKNVVDFIRDMKQQGKTIIISTHIFSVVDQLCDRVGIILKGQMKESFEVAKIKETSSIEDEFFKVYKEDGE